MKIADQYLEALKAYDGWVIVSDWARTVGEMYPDLLQKAEVEEANQTAETTGLREIAARIGSNIAGGTYMDAVEIDASERPRKVRFIPESERKQHIKQDIDEDIAPLRRDEIIRQAVGKLSEH